MRTPRSLIALTVVNSVLLAALLVQQFSPAFAANEPPILRGRGLEIVDSQGRTRASITVFPPQSASGGVQSETVLLRLITRRGGRPSKLARPSPARD
jgi:hypothetical protein